MWNAREPARQTSFLAVVGLSGLLAAAGACIPSYKYEELDRGTDSRLGVTTFYEDGHIAFFAVDTNVASRSAEREVLPLAVMLVNKGGKSIGLTPESFELRDAAGNRYPLISYEEFRQSHQTRVRSDERLSESFEEMTNAKLGIENSSLSTYLFEPLPFYGVNTPRRSSMELGTNRYTRGFLYFPMPAAGPRDQLLELNLRSPDLEDDLFLKFRVR